MLLVNSDAINVREPIEIEAADGSPATGLTHASPITFAYRRPADADWVAVSVVAGSSTHTDGGFRSLGGNVYEFCWPDSVVVASESTLLRYVYDSKTHYDVISARLPQDISATDIAAALSQVQLSVQTQLTLTSGTDLRVIQGDDYTRTGSKIVINLDTSGMIDPNIDLSSYSLVICGRNGSSLIAVRMPIAGSPGAHTVDFDPPSSLTETWQPGNYDLLYRIEWASDEFTTLHETGILRVDPFDIEPGDIVNI